MKYDLTLVPIEEGKPVLWDGKDYTIPAQRRSTILNGKDYYLRQNHQGDVRKISSFLEERLVEIVRALPDTPALIRTIIERGEE